MVHAKPLQHRLLMAAAALLVMGVATRTLAAGPEVVWVDNESFGFSGCGSSAHADAMPGDEDPRALMDAFRQRGLADAGQLLRARDPRALYTLTPVSGSLRCGGISPAVVFRISSFDRATGLAWSSQMVTGVLGFPSEMARAPGTR